jgi:uncharacterized protein (DUF305 family)
MRLITLLSILLLSLSLNIAKSKAGVEPDYKGGEPRVTTPWLDYQDQAARQADLDFINGMHPHHAGALSMSKGVSGR